jgi:hypothetical protein
MYIPFFCGDELTVFSISVMYGVRSIETELLAEICTVRGVNPVLAGMEMVTVAADEVAASLRNIGLSPCAC